MRKFIIVTLLIFILSTTYLTLSDMKIISGPSIDKYTRQNEIGCNRTTRQENLPQYDRALSLIKQRLERNQNNTKQNPRAFFSAFKPELTNCIKVIEKDLGKGSNTEGYFIFQDKEIKEDFYPIYVNSKYQESDDTLIALLLVHEMVHVQQYIDFTNSKKQIGCIDKEVKAFEAQERFFITGLIFEETQAIRLRINSLRDSMEYKSFKEGKFDNQLLMLDYINNEPGDRCPAYSCRGDSQEECIKKYERRTNCYDNTKPIIIKEKLLENEQYRKQCNL